MNPPLYAVIGIVRHVAHPGRELYVKRSPTMANYPGVWSLLSRQYLPEDLPDPTGAVLGRLPIARELEKMLRERLLPPPPDFLGQWGGCLRYLTSGVCSQNPLERRVTLHLYEFDLYFEPRVNPEYYTDQAWWTPEEFREATKDQTAECGLCLRLWSDYCVRHGLAAERFAPAPVLDER